MMKLIKNNFKGKLIVFEGTDGAGKTTLLSMTKDILGEKYGKENIICIKQPTELSRESRLFQKMIYSRDNKNIDYRAMQLLTLSDRMQQCHEVIIPALREGKIVLSDRYIFTSVANMYARGYTDEKWFFEAARHIVHPDYTFLVYVDPSQAIKRIRSRPEEKERYFDENLLYRVAAHFLLMSKRERMILVKSDCKEEKSINLIKKSIGRLL